MASNPFFPNQAAPVKPNSYTAAQNTAYTNALKMSSRQLPTDYRYDVNNDGRVNSEDAQLLRSGTPIRTDIDASRSKPGKVIPPAAPVAPVAAKEPTMADVMAALKAGNKELATNLQRQIVGLPPLEAEKPVTLQDAIADLKTGDKNSAVNKMRAIVGLPPMEEVKPTTMQDAIAALKAGDKDLATNQMREIVGLPPISSTDTTAKTDEVGPAAPANLPVNGETNALAQSAGLASLAPAKTTETPVQAKAAYTGPAWEVKPNPSKPGQFMLMQGSNIEAVGDDVNALGAMANTKNEALGITTPVVSPSVTPAKAEPTMQEAIAALRAGNTQPSRELVGLPALEATKTQGAAAAALPAEIAAAGGTGLSGLTNPLDSPYFQKNTPPPFDPRTSALLFDFEAYNQNLDRNDRPTMKITENTPGAVYVPLGSNQEYGDYWRAPTDAEVAGAKLQSQINQLPADIQAKINSGELFPQYSTTRVGRAQDGEDVPSGITGFTTNGPDGSYYTYDINGKKTGQIQNQSGGGGFLGGILNKIGSGVGDFIADPSKATTQFFENPGVKEAATVAAMYYGIPMLTEAAGLGAAGAAGTLGAAEGALTASQIAGLPGLAGAAGATTAALTPAALESLIGTAGYGTSAAAGAGSGAGAYLAGLGATGATLGAEGALAGGATTSAAPAALTAGSAPGSTLAATTATAVPEGLAALTTPAITSVAPEVLTAGSAPGSTLAATTGTVAPEGLASLGATTAPVTVGATEGALASELATVPATTQGGLASLDAALTGGSSVAPEILTAGSAPGSALAATTATTAPEVLAALTTPAVTSVAPEVLTAGSAPGSSLAATTATAVPEGLASLGGTGAAVEATGGGLGSLGTSVNEMVASGLTPGSAGASGAVTGALTPAELAAASGVVTTGATPALVTAAEEGAKNYIDSGGSAQSGFSGPGGTDTALNAADKVAGGTTSGGTLNTAVGNEAVASGLTPGSVGAAANAAGVLTPTQIAAATGAAGLGSLTGADAAAANLAASSNEAVASGLAPGSAGAAQAAAGTLTAAELAAAAGTNTGGIDLLDAAKKAKQAKDLLDKKNKTAAVGGTLGLAALLASMNKGKATDNNTYTGTVPTYSAVRQQLPVSQTRPGSAAAPYRPGQGGITYFTPVNYNRTAEPVAAVEPDVTTAQNEATAAMLQRSATPNKGVTGEQIGGEGFELNPRYAASKPGEMMTMEYIPQYIRKGSQPFDYGAFEAATQSAPKRANGGLMRYAEGGQVSAGLPTEGNQSMNYPSREGGYGYGGEGAIGQGGLAPQGALPQFAGLGSLGGNPLMAQGMNQGGINGLYGGANSPPPQYTTGGHSLDPSMQDQPNVGMARGGAVPGQYNLGSYSDGGRLLKGPGDGVSDSIPAIIGRKQPARLATGEFVIPARIVSELGNGSTEAGAQRLYEMMKRVQNTRRKTKNVAANTNAAKYLPA